MKLLWLGTGVLVLGLCLGIFLCFFLHNAIHDRQIQLLYGVDHEALLRACRELSVRVKTGSLKPGDYSVRLNPAPEISTFPKLLVDLNPSAIFVGSDGRIDVAMVGGLDHFGVRAYPDDYKKPNLPDFTFGDKELLPGLWYYDDGYREFKEMGKDYDKYIEALRPRAH